MQIGVLAVQGDIREHAYSLETLDHTPVFIREPEQLNDIQALVMPGGESTAMTVLMRRYCLWDALKESISNGLPVYGTCAGLVLLSRRVYNYPEQPTLRVLNVEVERNAYGSQADSFETSLKIKGLDDELFAFFIRAPIIRSWDNGVEILAEHGGTPVLVRQGNTFASSFHPELTHDLRIHKMFLESTVVRKTS